MRHVPIIAIGVLAVPTLILVAQGQPQAENRGQPAGRDLESRVRTLEKRVANLERHIQRLPPTVTGKLDGMPRKVVDAVGWAHPRAEVTDTDRDEDDGLITWEVELTADGIDWVMLISPDGRIIDDRVDD